MAKMRWTTENIADQTGRVAIVTGGNSGIGYETAKALLEKGAKVIVASRSAERGARAVDALRGTTNGSAELLLLDLANQASVQAFAAGFKAKHDRLDLLINNAGVMMPAKREETADGFELQFGTNHLGHFALTALLLDRLIETSGSRIVNVSSTAQKFGKLDLDDMNWTRRPFDRMGSYGSSKIANMLFTLELQRKLTESGASTIATSAHPGWTATNLQKNSPLFRFLNPLMAMRPPQGALPSLYAAVSDEAKPGGYYGPHGLGNMRGYPEENQRSAVSGNKAIAVQLWTLSESLVGIESPNLA